MKKFLIYTITLLLVFGMNPEEMNAKTKEARQVLLFDNTVTESEKSELLERYQLQLIEEVTPTMLVVMGTTGVVHEHLLAVEEDILYEPQGIKVKKKDISTTPQPEETIPWGVLYYGHPSTWETAGDGVKVAIIDSGIDMNHPDLQFVDGINTIDKKKDIEDTYGHGTHIAGIIAAPMNGIGTVGISNADLYIVKVMNDAQGAYLSDLLEGIDWAIKKDVDIINLSMSTSVDSVLLHDKLIEAKEAGITIVAAAGNNRGGEIMYPSAYDEVIGVGGLSEDGTVSYLSATIGVEHFAPGEMIYSTYINESYTYMSGTSMAAPYYIRTLLN